MKKSNPCSKKAFNYLIWIYFKCLKSNAWLDCIMVSYPPHPATSPYTKKKSSKQNNQSPLPPK